VYLGYNEFGEMKQHTETKQKLFKKNDAPLKVIQFGEGNFLRAFVGHTIDKLNALDGIDMGIAVVQPIEHGMIDVLEEQGGAYTLFLNGILEGQEKQETHLIHNIVSTHNPYKDYANYLALARNEDLQFVISNTTEAGIVFQQEDGFEDTPQKSFPGKLTRFLWERFQHFKGAPNSGLHFLPCELINYNADELKRCILAYCKHWQLEDAFVQWVEKSNYFHNTLVDRIVPGYPKDNADAYQKQLPYEDQLMVTAEPFYLWVIEGDDRLAQKFPVHLIDLNVQLVADMQPYRTRKVRILNGAHTALVPLSILFGHKTVSDIFSNSFTHQFLMDSVLKEIVPTLAMEKEELIAFAKAVFDRFKNPFIKHYLSSIALNSISKFKVRVLPSLLAYQEKHNQLPVHLTFAMACLLRFYKGQWKGESLPVQDDASLVAALQKAWEAPTVEQFLQTVLANETYWGANLSANKPLMQQLNLILGQIDTMPLDQLFSEFKTQLEDQNV